LPASAFRRPAKPTHAPSSPPQCSPTDTHTAIPRPLKLPCHPTFPGRSPPVFRGEREVGSNFSRGSASKGEVPGHPEPPATPPTTLHRALTTPSRSSLDTFRALSRSNGPFQAPDADLKRSLRSGSPCGQGPRGLWVSTWVRAAIWQKCEPTQWPGADASSATRRQSAGLVALSAPTRERSRGTNPQQSGVNLGNGYLP
jgi:hypothetical protein